MRQPAALLDENHVEQFPRSKKCNEAWQQHVGGWESHD